MDKRTRAEINKINSRIPRRLADNIIKTTVDTTNEEAVRIALADKNISESSKSRLRLLLKKGAFRHTTTDTDEEVAAEIDKYLTRAMAKAQKDGRLTPASKDPFWVERQKRIKEHKND